MAVIISQPIKHYELRRTIVEPVVTLCQDMPC